MRRRSLLLLVWFLAFPFLAAGPHQLPPLVVVIDAGHGGEDPGAVVAGVKEKDIVLDIVLRVFELSQGGPVQVVLTRATDRYIGLKERVRFAEEVGAALYLSVHANYLSDPRVRGIEVWVDNTRDPDDPSWELARTVLSALVRETGAADRGVRSQKLYLRHTELPAALVEVGYLSNPGERRRLLDPAHRARVARGILEGIYAFLGL
ncbi:N-acetylmuramoyl-L-alanine amidase family protein [Candidatus Bipolaricaulota sp. J31]